MIKPPPEASDPVRVALAGLDGAGWTALRDVPWPGRDHATIDHVVVGPPGVFVIDTRHWEGEVSAADGVLTHDGRSRERALIHLGAATVAVMRLHPRVPTVPVLCVVGGQPDDDHVREALLCTPEALPGVLASRPARLSPDEVTAVVATLEDELSGRSGRFESLPRTGRPAAGPLGVLVAGLCLVVSLGISIVGGGGEEPPAGDGVSQPRDR